MAEITAPDEPPTRARLSVVILLCALAFVLYMDRVCMSQAVTPIKKEFGLTNVQMTYVLNAFLIAYALFELPTGRWGDRFGSNRVLTRIVLWWSAFTVLTGASGGLASLIVIRFLFGAGEAGAYPNAARVIRRWFPLQERGRVQGLLVASGLLGGVVSQVLAGYLMDTIGWRWTFVVFGAVGVLWVAAFCQWFHENPADHPGVRRLELELIASAPDAHVSSTTHAQIPWKAIVGNRSFWLLGIAIACAAFCSYLFFSWYPTYMQESRGLSSSYSGWLSGTVLTGGMIGTLCGGLVSDWLVRYSTNVTAARQYFGFASSMLAATLLVLGVRSDAPWLTVAFTATSFLVLSMQNPIWWTTVTDLSGLHLGALFGLLNAMGVCGALASQYFFGLMADRRAGQGYSGREQWDPAFYVYASVMLFGGLCWLAVNSNERIDTHTNDDPALNLEL
jgi:MFS family permease